MLAPLTQPLGASLGLGSFLFVSISRVLPLCLRITVYLMPTGGSRGRLCWWSWSVSLSLLVDKQYLHSFRPLLLMYAVHTRCACLARSRLLSRRGAGGLRCVAASHPPISLDHSHSLCSRTSLSQISSSRPPVFPPSLMFAHTKCHHDPLPSLLLLSTSGSHHTTPTPPALERLPSDACAERLEPMV